METMVNVVQKDDRVSQEKMAVVAMMANKVLQDVQVLTARTDNQAKLVHQE